MEYYYLAICYSSYYFCGLAINFTTFLVTATLDACEVAVCGAPDNLSSKNPPVFQAATERRGKKNFEFYATLERRGHLYSICCSLFGYSEKCDQLGVWSRWFNSSWNINHAWI